MTYLHPLLTLLIAIVTVIELISELITKNKDKKFGPVIRGFGVKTPEGFGKSDKFLEGFGAQSGLEAKIRETGILRLKVHSGEELSVRNPRLGQTMDQQQPININISIYSQEADPHVIERSIVRSVKLARLRGGI